MDPSAFRIEIDYILKSRKAAVVHIRCSSGNIAERRRLERAVIARITGEREPAFVGKMAVLPCHTGIVKFLIGEIRTSVTCRAAALSTEQLKARFFA